MSEGCIKMQGSMLDWLKKAVFIPVILVLISAGSVGAVTNVTGCGTLSTAGETYVLQNDISTTGTCITIGGDNIILDGAGYRITGSGSGNGVYLNGRSGVTVKNLNVSGFSYGIYLESSSNNNLTNNTASDNTYGIGLNSASNYNTLTNNIASSNIWYGIHLVYSSNYNILTGNTASNNQIGIRLTDSRNNTLANNNANSNAWYGIYLSSSSNNTLTNNNASNNSNGISLSSSSNNTLTGNAMNSNTYNFYLSGFQDSHFDNSIDTSNTVDGKPIYYVRNTTDIVYNNSTNAGTFYCIWCDNVTIKDLTLTKNGYGVFFWSTNNSKIENVNASNNEYGIYLYSSSNNNLTGNTANSNNRDGIYLYWSSNNTITNNNASNNNYGILLESSSSNTIYNNFFNNTANFYFWGTATNTWNTARTLGTNIGGGPYIGGNFWANPSGTGFSETCTDADGDGICDFNYELASGNRDNLPLAKVVGQNNDCIVINQSGFYSLDNNLVNVGATCIEITSSDVVFDGAGYSIDGRDTYQTYGVLVNSSTTLTNVTVKNLVVTDWDIGIYYNNTENGSITNNTVKSNTAGILLVYSGNSTVENNTVKSNVIGIALGYSGNNTIENNTANSNGFVGIYLRSSSNNTLANNTVNSNPEDGIDLHDSSGNIITGNNVSGNGGSGAGDGIYLSSSSNNIIKGNTANSNNGGGIHLRSSSNYNTLTDNTASSNVIGIGLSSSSNNTIYNNFFNNDNNFYFSGTIYSNDWNTTKQNGTNIIGGPYIGGNFWAELNGNGFSETCTDADGDGICDSGYTLASGNVDYLPLIIGGGVTPISSCTMISMPGVYVLTTDIMDSSATKCIEITSSNVTFDGAGHTIDGTGSNTGIYVHNTGTTLINVTVRNVTVTDWDRGIYYEGVINGSIKDNNASNNVGGIQLFNSRYNAIENNNASNNIHGIYFGYNSKNNTISNNTASNNDYYGIYLSFSSNNTITNNIASNNSYMGICLLSSSNNTLTGNIMSANTRNFGIDSVDVAVSHFIQTIDTSNTVDGKPIYYLVGVSDLVIDSSNNTGYVGIVNGVNVTVRDLALTKNGQGVLFVNISDSSVENVTASNNDYGIWLYRSRRNTLTNNTANSNSQYGIWLDSSSSNTLTGNTANSNNNGIYLYSSSSNTIYNNYFNNTDNVDLSSSTNAWNTARTLGTNIVGGPYLGGNFWANPSGTGFSETCTDADRDGICDSSYNLASGNVDYLPLVVVSTPSIEISKFMISGETTVNIETKEYWVLEIEVNNDGQTDLSNVVVSDTIPQEITLDGFTVSKGSVATTVKNGATKLIWTIGTMLSGDTEALVLDVSTKTDGTTQYFVEAGEHVLNEGASVSGDGGRITAGPTDPITVYAKQTKRHRGRMGGGHRQRGR